MGHSSYVTLKKYICIHLSEHIHIYVFMYERIMREQWRGKGHEDVISSLLCASLNQPLSPYSLAVELASSKVPVPSALNEVIPIQACM